MTLHVLAYAKLNLYLNVCGVRLNGYHDIQSLVQTIDLADRIAIMPASDVRLSCSQKLGGINSVQVAVDRLLKEKKSQAGVHIWIEKHIPVGAGLGGGSSDAAAVLSVLNGAIPPILSDETLLKIAATIGADVPLFLAGGCVEVVGLGTPKACHPLRTETFIVFVPDLQCSTRDVYESWKPHETSCNQVNWGHNDLAAAAIRIQPELKQIGERMRGLGELYSGMTGSGAGFFAAFASARDAAQAFTNVSRQLQDGRVYYCQPTECGYVELLDRPPTEFPNSRKRGWGDMDEDRD